MGKVGCLLYMLGPRLTSSLELQGIHTVRPDRRLLRTDPLTPRQAKDIHNFLQEHKRVEGYPLFDNVYRICWEGLPVEKLTEGL